MGVHFKLTPSHRAAIEDQIESLIGMLDGFDAPFEDLEPEDDRCDAADDGCGPLEGHRALYASEEYDRHRLPRYGVDQSTGPINQREVEREQYAAEMGLVRSPTGGWRRPH